MLDAERVKRLAEYGDAVARTRALVAESRSFLERHLVAALMPVPVIAYSADGVPFCVFLPFRRAASGK